MQVVQLVYLKESQRGMVAARMANLTWGGGRSKAPSGALTQRNAAKAVGTTSVLSLIAPNGAISQSDAAKTMNIGRGFHQAVSAN